MKNPPFSVQRLYFVGIGGIGMSAIAEIMHNMGYQISGSNLDANNNVHRLRNMGITVHIGHQASNVSDAEVVVISSAVKPSNIEVQTAMARNIPVIPRSEMLAELMRLKWAISVAGSHGKTTTTAMLAHILDETNQDPTVINGGILMSHGSNAKLGSSDLMVVETDESDGSFQHLPSTVGIVTNIDYEHMDYYGSAQKLHDAFLNFLKRLPFYGFAVVNVDLPDAAELIKEVHNRRIITYGLEANAHVQLSNIRQEPNGIRFDLSFNDHYPVKKELQHRTIKDIFLPSYGAHNALNATAVITVLLELGIDSQDIKFALKNFKGVKRRFNILHEDAHLTVIDDYAHHPTEIVATMKAAKNRDPNKKLVAIMQPHRFTRVRDHFEEYVHATQGADEAYFMPIHPAGEDPIDGINAEELAKAANAQVLTADGMADFIQDYADRNCTLLFMGAGSISTLLHEALETINLRLAV